MSAGTHKPAEAMLQIGEPGREEFRTLVTEAARAPLLARIAELEADNASLRGINSAQDKALAELESQLEAIGAGGVESLRKQAPQVVPDERAAFEVWLGIKPCGAAHDFGWDAWQARAALAAAQPAAQGMDAMTPAARDVLAERQRQISAEGWTPESDDRYAEGDMSDAAGCYALHAFFAEAPTSSPPAWWPWAAHWWKPSTPRRDLEKAGALILAEIERIDRAAIAAQAKQGDQQCTSARES